MTIETKETTKFLSCTLTDKEKLAFADDVGRETQLHQGAVDRKSEVSKQLTADVELHRGRVQRLGTLLANGYELRDVSCKVEINRDRDKVKVTRIDTGEVIEERKMNASERQAEMPI